MIWILGSWRSSVLTKVVSFFLEPLRWCYQGIQYRTAMLCLQFERQHLAARRYQAQQRFTWTQVLVLSTASVLWFPNQMEGYDFARGNAMSQKIGLAGNRYSNLEKRRRRV